MREASSMRKFNVTGLCIPEEDYMVDISGKIEQIKKLIDRRSYFTINRARQYGKTTMLNELKKALESEYICISTSFESLGNESFSSSNSFCRVFMGLVQKALRYTLVDEEYIEKWMNENVTTFETLGDHITTMCRGKKIVLMVDEVDKASNNQAFLHFLSVLRGKFLGRKLGTDYTFHSVILAGVHDVKNIKLKMIQEGTYVPYNTENKVYNSPWNIAANFNIDMSFNAAEIETMLIEYEADYNTGMNVRSVSEELHKYTSGYPFLVSRMCQIIEEDLDSNWTTSGVADALKIITTTEKNTLFDDLIKNLHNNPEIYNFMYEILILGDHSPRGIYSPEVEWANMFGFIKIERNGSTSVSNKIFESILVKHFISAETKAKQVRGSNDKTLLYQIARNGIFDMELCLRKFKEFFASVYDNKENSFYERYGLLMFLSYLNPLINGRGFYHIESETSDGKRMDLVLDYGTSQYIIELKLWNGKALHERAFDQLLGYMDAKNADKGYLLTFDLRTQKNKQPKAEWISIEGKKIFDVVV